ncbi:hypothetical protein CSUI_006937 [Cystoisospora suis]|uniref:Uncharacterized protein n=1 Tax=Cystoisospora suis TaxID=483139 RepID=A0A2C6KSQ5_9APIC|nr:hypothetical protein CSUI_006937 [Cystoisospora suis]
MRCISFEKRERREVWKARWIENGRLKINRFVQVSMTSMQTLSLFYLFLFLREIHKEKNKKREKEKERKDEGRSFEKSARVSRLLRGMQCAMVLDRYVGR